MSQMVVGPGGPKGLICLDPATDFSMQDLGMSAKH